MELNGGRRGVYPFMAQPNNIHEKGKKSSLITNTKPQASRIWVSLGEEKRKRATCKCKYEL